MERHRRRGSRAARLLGTSPQRLYALGAAMQAGLLGILGLSGGITDPGTVIGLLLHALATLWLGRELEQLPRRLGALAPGYPLYAAAGLLITGGAGLAAWWPGATGPLLALGGWLMALRSLHWKLRWARPAATLPLRARLWLLGALAGLPLLGAAAGLY